MPSYPHSFRTMTVGETWELPWVCWKMAKDNYSNALTIAVVLGACYLPVFIAPLFGKVFGAAMAAFISFGIVRVCRKWENNESTEFSEFFIGLQDEKERSRLIPLAAASGGLAFFMALISLGAEKAIGTSLALWGFGTLLTLGLALVQASFTYFSSSIMAFDTQIDWQGAIRLSMKKYFENLVPLAISGIVFMAIAVICLIAFVVPILLLFAPLSVPCLYYLYRCIFEGLVLKAPTEDKSV